MINLLHCRAINIWHEALTLHTVLNCVHNVTVTVLYFIAGLWGNIHLLMHPACRCAPGVCRGRVRHRQIPELTPPPLQDHAGGEQQWPQCRQDDGEGVVASGGRHSVLVKQGGAAFDGESCMRHATQQILYNNLAGTAFQYSSVEQVTQKVFSTEAHTMRDRQHRISEGNAATTGGSSTTVSSYIDVK